MTKTAASPKSAQPHRNSSNAKAPKPTAPRAPTKAAKKTVPKRASERGNAKAAVRASSIHGQGVVARVAIAPGERVCEYRGERIDWPEALRRHPHDPEQPFHTFYFSIDDEMVIDGNVGGDFSRFINHSCDPNCETEMVETRGMMRVYVQALRDIEAGDELTYDYGLTLDERYTPTLKKQFACHCGSANCRGTMLSPKR